LRRGLQLPLIFEERSLVDIRKNIFELIVFIDARPPIRRSWNSGNPLYHRFIRTQIMRRTPHLVDPDDPQSWGQVAPLAYWSYYFSGRDDCDPAILELIRRSTLDAARTVSERTAQSPWRHSLLRKNFIWGSNSVALNYSLLLRIADRMEPTPAFRDSAMDNLHYVLGRNAFDVCWVTRLGTHPMQHPHHRPSASNPPDQPWPGLLSGGPNAGRQDPVLRRLPDNTPPGLCWVDERGSYAGNEVAINWNAPLVFALSAALPETSSKRDHTLFHRQGAKTPSRIQALMTSDPQ